MRVDDNEYADPAVNEPKVIDPPETIWLVYGDLEHDDTHTNCCASGEVMWCEDAQFAADVRYVRAATAEAKSLALELSLSDLRNEAMRTLVAWDGTVLPKARDGLMQDRMECLRAALAALGPNVGHNLRAAGGASG
jgi:hypothetical protein